jgi:hypothetical protein
MKVTTDFYLELVLRLHGVIFPPSYFYGMVLLYAQKSFLSVSTYLHLIPTVLNKAKILVDVTSMVAKYCRQIHAFLFYTNRHKPANFKFSV